MKSGLPFLIFLSLLRHLVPNPGGVVQSTTAKYVGRSMPGARVATETSIGGRSATALPDHTRSGTKVNEV